jgi:DNA-binding response OmpR family regulator
MQSTLLLLVEDEDTVRSVLEETLRDGGFDLKIAGNGADALAILESDSETVRGLITDINLGSGPSGWDVAKRARELVPELPVVYMSGADAEKWASHGVPNSTIVTKPFAPAQIVTAISTLLNVTDTHP